MVYFTRKCVNFYSKYDKRGDFKVARLIKQFSDGSYYCYDTGRFDNWCVYSVEDGSQRKPLSDKNYFQDVYDLGEIYGEDDIYNIFVEVYKRTTKDLLPEVLEYIATESEKYPEDQLVFEKTFVALYATMVAEENKEFTKLGKRIKWRGIHGMFYGGLSPLEAATRDYGVPWIKIAEECVKFGF